MSDSNKLVLQKANAAILDGDYEGFLSFCTEDTEWVFEGDQRLTGKAAVRKWMGTAYVEPPKFKVERLIAEGASVVAIGEITLEDQHGHPVLHSYCDVWRFRDGQMAELRAFVLPRTK